MSLLEDRILRIIELKEQGLDSKAIAEDLNLSTQSIETYYESTRAAISKITNTEPIDLASVLGISPLAAEVVSQHYNRQNGPHNKLPIKSPGKYLDNIEKIRILSEAGKTVDQIANELGLQTSTVYTYKSKMNLSKKLFSSIKNKEKVASLLEGGSTYEAIGQALGLTTGTVRGYAAQQGLTRQYSLYEINVKKIRNLALICPSVERIANAIGLKASTVMIYAYQNNIQLPRKNKSQHETVKVRGHKSLEERRDEIKTCIKNGLVYIEDVAERLQVQPAHCYNLCLDADIHILFREQKNRYKFVKRKPIVDALIREGLPTLENIGKKVNLTRERIRQYIVATDQQEIWDERRRERKNILGTIVSQINSVGSNLADQIEQARLLNTSEKEKWAYEKVQKYFEVRRWSENIDFDLLFSLFQDYHAFQQQSKKVSLEWFAKKYKIWTPSIGRIFKDVGLKPLVLPHHKKCIVTSNYKKQCLENAVEAPINPVDVAYFLDIPFYVSNQFFRIHYKGDKQRPPVNKWIKIFDLKNKLSYRFASQIYETLDTGFSKEEIIESFGLSEELYNYALENKPEISQHIMNSLRIIFPERKEEINKPYREFSLA